MSESLPQQTKPTRQMYIDNPWDEVERLIRETVLDELCDVGAEEPRDAIERWAEPIAKRAASRVMQHLDGGDYESDKHGLRK